MTEPRIQTLTIEDVEVPGGNPNRMEPPMFERLKATIEKVGFLQPILVREQSGPESVPFVLVDGEHRLRALISLGRTEVPAVVIDAEADVGAALRIGMNRMRGEMNLMDVGRAFEELLDDGWSLEELEISGFANNEIKGLLDAISHDEDDLFDEPMDTAPAKEKKPTLSIRFDSEAEKTRVKAALLEIAGEDRSIGEALVDLVSAR